MSTKITVIEPIREKIEADLPEEEVVQRVAAYARVSTEQDEQQNSYEAQVDYYTRYITSHPGWELVRVYADEGITGTNRKKRDEFNRMVEDAKAGKIDLILTKSISRFARNTVDALQVVRELKAAKVEVIFEKENLHTMDPRCEVMLTIMSSLAQEESRSISENVRWGKRKRMADGIVTMTYSTFLGYRKGEDGKPEIVPEEAEIVREIYTRFLDGETFRGIADALTKKGILTPGGKQRWSSPTVKSILTNEKYKGDALLQKTYTEDFIDKRAVKNDGDLRQYYVKGSHEAIISPEMFDEVQKLLEKQAGSVQKARSSSGLSGMIVCADCGSYFGHKVWRTSNHGERYDVWYCNNRYNGEAKCQTPVVRETALKAALDKAMAEADHDPKVAKLPLKLKVESVTITRESELVLKLKNGKEIVVLI